MAASLAADVKESILKASGIAAGEELLRMVASPLPPSVRGGPA